MCVADSAPEALMVGPQVVLIGAGVAGAWGVGGEVVEADRWVELAPMLDRDRVLGGLHVPTDGLAKAVRAVQAQVERAAARGVRVLERTEVLDVRTDGDRVTSVL